MAPTSTGLPHADRFSAWFPDFLRKELSPYPGRAAVVARMVIAATITTILIVTFRIPGGAIGVLCAFLLSREDLLSTAKSALYLLAAFVIGALFIPVGARLFASIPITHFLWEAVSIFIAFFLLRTLANYALALGLCVVATNVLSIWYLPGPAERNVELTLWQVAATLIGLLVTLAVEIVFHAFHHVDEVVKGVDVRLQQIENLMEDYASNRPPSPDTTRMLAQYAVVGMGSLRRHIARTGDEPIHRMRMSALVSLAGRSTDFAAALSSTVSALSPEERQRAVQLSQRIAGIRRYLNADASAPPAEPDLRGTTSPPLLSELESMIALIPSAFAGESSMDPRLQILEPPPSSNRIFVEDAFTNPKHLRFVLSGTLAAMICYVLYVSLNWPGISTSVTTCVLTALTNVGASRQKQVLRIAGALLGGFVFGLGAQIFILPNIDSISGFAVLIAFVTAVAAWVSTSSSRLSYAGMQIALAFYLINLSEFRIQTSLSVGRDRAIGVLLGISMMWLVFERFYYRPAADEMVDVFSRNLRLMAELIKTSSGVGDTAAIVKIRRQRDQIYRYFGDVNAQADAVPFETGPARAAHMAARDRIRRWQASLRTFYLLETPLIQFRVFGDPNQKSRPFTHIDDIIREECARSLEDMAASLENQLISKPYDIHSNRSLTSLLEESAADGRPTFSEREEALLRMLRTIASLIDRVQDEIASEPLYATE
jgi:multidrug resistance protein MdtO